jgi:hypothetical protein
LVIEADDVEPGIRELRCASALKPWRSGDELLSVYAHVLPERPHAYRSLDEARASLRVVPLARS